MEQRTDNLTMSELGTLMKILSGEELDWIIRHQDPEWVTDVYRLIEEEPDVADALLNGGSLAADAAKSY